MTRRPRPLPLSIASASASVRSRMTPAVRPWAPAGALGDTDLPRGATPPPPAPPEGPPGPWPNSSEGTQAQGPRVQLYSTTDSAGVPAGCGDCPIGAEGLGDGYAYTMPDA